ncbi:NADH-quinone oxidoreductase subunit NuoG [Rickettsiella grylli]|uniref:NADH-quinone oxidoreductase n=1 Tax=Rickettsiella grylli TaxID=59196 RepID=A8PM88_9COXI|nr:NADH-quinone oxidoreductase subunit NuoG [Rickettsiella grylli]EDP46021.1 NADH dehydrogenase (quinone), g subunit [Rickettsiella grylli]
MIDIEIDGRLLRVEQNTTIIEAADKAGIYIPRFCYHKKLSIVANCRMCLVDVEKFGKPLPACATPVTAGMKVYTTSDKTKEAQRAVMEFLLINHPLDCPICDQGGECELQDLSLGYGSSLSRFTEGKRSVKDDNLGPLISTEMTRCIQCTRCVRFGQEIAGIKELGTLNRGEDLQISTYIEHSLESELSGNIIDLCPVGALTSKPFRFKARAWELQQSASIAPHDCCGSNIYLHTRRGQVLRAVPRENEAINETWLSDRDRYSYLGIHSKDRLTKPLIKEKGRWVSVDWDTALTKVVNELKQLLKTQDSQAIGGLASPSCTTEEFYFFQKLLRSLGTSHIDHRLHQIDVSDQMQATLCPPGIRLTELEKATFVWLIGSNIRREQPIAAHRLRKASLAGAKIASLHCVDIQVPFSLSENKQVSPDALVPTLLGIANAVGDPQSLAAFSDFTAISVKSDVVHQLKSAKNALIVLGALAHNHPQASLIRELTHFIAQRTGARCIYFTEGANSMGAWLAGAVPHRLPGGISLTKPGLAAAEMFNADLRAFILLNIEPTLDCANPQRVSNALKQADFVLALSPFKAKSLLEHAHVILPMASFAEIEGSFINMGGCWQTFSAAIPPIEQARSGWEILQTVGNRLALEAFNRSDHAFIREKLEPFLLEYFATPSMGERGEQKLKQKQTHDFPSKKKIQRISEWSLYGVDSVVRRALALQVSASNPHHPVRIVMNAALAHELKVTPGQWVRIEQGRGEALLPLSIQADIPDNCVYIPAGCEQTETLGESFGEVILYVE